MFSATASKNPLDLNRPSCSSRSELDSHLKLNMLSGMRDHRPISTIRTRVYK